MDQQPLGFQRWCDLLFVHWTVPVAALRRLVPEWLAIDLFEGRAYVTMIPFRIVESRPAGFPQALSTHFLEANLRTYVRAPDGQAGIYFFSLEASSVLAVVGARLLYALPYYLAAMSAVTTGARTTYTSRRLIGRPAWLDATYVVSEPAGSSADAIDHFLVERYLLYVHRGRALYRTRVRHAPYPLKRVTLERLDQTLVEAAGLPNPGPVSACHFSPGVDVHIYWHERVP